MWSKILSKISNQENVGKILLDLNFKFDWFGQNIIFRKDRFT